MLQQGERYSYTKHCISNVLLTRVTKYKYHGHCLSGDFCDDDDMAKQHDHHLYTQGNALLRKVFMCTKSVKITLFSSFCMTLYACELRWNHYV